jgi:CubicO group peptidase (beta-lactamase class C family)
MSFALLVVLLDDSLVEPRKRRRPMKKTVVKDAQRQVQDAIGQLVEAGTERGIQVAVYREADLVVDAVAGIADPASGRPITPDTPFYNFSVGKGAASTIVHVLAQRGLFGYDTPVAELWPEFGAHGKQSVTVRHVLNHTAGVPGIPLDTTVEDLCNWDKMCAAIADEELWWEPGTKVGYHAYSFGYIAGEIVRRATGKRISRVLREDLAGPLGVADEIYFGMPESEHHRLARLEDAPMAGPMPEMPPDLPMFKAGPMSTFPNATMGNRSDVLSADIPAGGKTSARAIARMYAALMTRVDGIRLISPERLREATAVSSSGIDQVFGNPSTWALGFALGGLGTPQDSNTTFGVGGFGGSFACADTATGISFAVTKNRISPDFTTATQLRQLVNEAVSRR